MRNIVIGLLLFASCVCGQQRRDVGVVTTQLNQIVPLVIVGEGWTQRIIIQNVDTLGNSIVGHLAFFTTDGEPWTVDLANLGSSSSFPVNLAPGQAAVFETVPSNEPQTLGWAAYQPTDDIGDMFGQVTFRKQSEGRADLMTSLPLGAEATDSMSVFFDNTGGNYTGFGIVTPYLCFSTDCSVQRDLQVTIRRLDGSTMGEHIVRQAPNRLSWVNLGVQFPETVGSVGTISVAPVEKYSVTVTGFSLQFAGNGAFTAIMPFED